MDLGSAKGSREVTPGPLTGLLLGPVFGGAGDHILQVLYGWL